MSVIKKATYRRWVQTSSGTLWKLQIIHPLITFLIMTFVFMLPINMQLYVTLNDFGMDEGLGLSCWEHCHECIHKYTTYFVQLPGSYEWLYPMEWDNYCQCAHLDTSRWKPLWRVLHSVQMNSDDPKPCRRCHLTVTNRDLKHLFRHNAKKCSFRLF